MMALSTGLFFVAALTILTLVHNVAAHGYVPQIKIGSQYIPGWDVSKGSYSIYYLYCHQPAKAIFFMI